MSQSINWTDNRPAGHPHREYREPDDRHSLEQLVVSAAGDAATSIYLHWTGAGETDDRRSRARLRHLGAGFFKRRRLMREARLEAERLACTLKKEILAVAAALRERRVLGQDQIDAVIKALRGAPIKSMPPTPRTLNSGLAE